MFKNMKIGMRIALGFGVVLILTTATIIPVMLSKVNSIVAEAERHELRGLFENVKAAIEAEGRLGEALSALAANIPAAQSAFAQDQREQLSELFLAPFSVLKEQYGARQFQFHTPPATSYFRVHKPKKFGDDLSSFRKTVVATNDYNKPVRGIERGVAGLGVRGMVPVYHEGKHLGSVEFGMSFGQPFFENFKKQYNVDLVLHIAKDGDFETYASTFGKQEALTTAELNQALAGQDTVRQLVINNTSIAAFAGTVKDFSGKPVGVLEIIKDRSSYARAVSDTRNIAIMIGMLSLAGAFLVAWLITRGITRPIQTAVSAMEDIAEGDGDLTCRLDVKGRDEIAQLSSAFNQFAEKMHAMVKEVASSTSHLADATERVKQLSVDSSDGVERQSLEVNHVATAMTEMTQTVQEVAKNASEAAQAAQQADGEANNGQHVVSQTISSIDALAQEVERASEAINRLEKDSEGIGTVLDVIRGIAEQTNLLALNAAIEAARAGEQGRGFAVVADEVRTLASRTQQSTQEIQGMIEGLQGGARDAVDVMSQGRLQASKSVEQAKLAGESLTKITQAVTAITNMNVQIAAAAEEQTAVAEEINGNVINITQVAEQVKNSAQDAAGSSNDLAQLSAQLERLISQFKV